MYYLGMDGGGTKTAFTVIDKKGNICLEKLTGTTDYMQCGFDGFETLLKDIIATVCKELNITLKELEYAFFGVPCYGEVKADSRRLYEIINNIFVEGNFSVGNDVESGWAGGLACEAGINVVCGTGAIAFGKDENNNSSRSSGWGYLCGDEGSAYWIALKGIEIFTKESDGRLDKTFLYKHYKKELDIDDDFKIIDIIHNQFKEERNKIASLSRLVYESAREGDKYATKIFEQAAYEIFLMIETIYSNLDFGTHVKVSYNGGVFNSKELLIDPLRKICEKSNFQISLQSKIMKASTGSALYAYKLSGHTINKNIINKLRGK
ncbi:MAG TPA: BadF/BadG/BcrA/BcrD ATPase family protein [Victivallales bacterium]|nr:BadF/BadG/BcrA/BcrD ATPase family protein [Victivallales bacterium]